MVGLGIAHQLNETDFSRKGLDPLWLTVRVALLPIDTSLYELASPGVLQSTAHLILLLQTLIVRIF